MCSYRYIYYSRCRHQELVLFEYCDKAKHPATFTPTDTTHQPYRPTDDTNNSTRPSENAADRNTDSTQPALGFEPITGAPHWNTPSDCARRLDRRQSWPLTSQRHRLSRASRKEDMASSLDSQALASRDELYTFPDAGHESCMVPFDFSGQQQASSDFAPRSILLHGSPQDDNKTQSSTFEVDFPMESCSGFTVEFHKDGKVKKIVAQLESDIRCRQGSGELSVDESDRANGSDDGHMRALSPSSAYSLGYSEITMPSADHSEDLLPPSLDTENVTTTSRCADDGSKEDIHKTRSTDHGRETLGKFSEIVSSSPLRLDTTGAFDHLNPKGTVRLDSRTPRKPIPVQWQPKFSAPRLSTAQRAADRETRKKPAESEVQNKASPKTVRSTRKSATMMKEPTREATAFLTKEAVDAVENVFVQPQRTPRQTNALKKTTSKPTLKGPANLKHSPSVKFTVSPAQSPKSPVTREGSSPKKARTAHASSSSNSSVDTVYVSAAQSPVSRSSRSSVHSFVTATEHHDSLRVPLDLTLTDVLDDKQGLRTSKSVGSLAAQQSTIRAADKSVLKRSGAPKLAPLKIPQSPALSSKEKISPLVLSSSGSSAISPASPSHSSRIPRMTIRINHGRTSAGPSPETDMINPAPSRRRDTVSTIISDHDDNDEQAISSIPRNETGEDMPGSGGNMENMAQRVDSARPVDSSHTGLDDAVPARRMVMTVNSRGTTPILSDTPATSVSVAADTCNDNDLSEVDSESPSVMPFIQSLQKLVAFTTPPDLPAEAFNPLEASADRYEDIDAHLKADLVESSSMISKCAVEASASTIRPARKQHPVDTPVDCQDSVDVSEDGQCEGDHADPIVGHVAEALVTALSSIVGDTSAAMSEDDHASESEDWIPIILEKPAPSDLQHESHTKTAPLSDPAIVYSGGKPDQSTIDHADEPISEFVKRLLTKQDESAVDYLQASGQDDDSHWQADTSREPSHLRATAPEFVPVNTTPSATRPMLPGEWVEGIYQFNAPVMETAMLLSMYQNQMNPYDFTAGLTLSSPASSPTKKSKKRKWKKPLRKSKSASPIKGDSSTGHQEHQLSYVKTESSHEDHPAAETDTAFSKQFEAIDRLASGQNNTFEEKKPLSLPRGSYASYHDYSSGRRRRGWENIRTAVNNGLFSGPNPNASGSQRSRAMPLSSTAPFPDPLPPSRGGDRGRREYVGYTAEERGYPPADGPREPCGVYNIESAAEYVNGICHECDP